MTSNNPSRPTTHRVHNYDHVLDAIKQYKQDHDGNSPTMRELAQLCNVRSTSQVLYILNTLEAEGKIRLTGERRTRSICVVGGQWIPPTQGNANESN